MYVVKFFYDYDGIVKTRSQICYMEEDGLLSKGVNSHPEPCDPTKIFAIKCEKI